jgi:hypothetical protein
MSNNYTYDPLNDPGYYTGELSATSIVDQKDTYMAFCAAVGGRNEPEIIKSQKYEITTLIDENGEIYSPNDSDVAVSSIIKNVFGRGKRTEIRVISNPGNANLNYPGYRGTHTSQGVGYFQNILVTTYGTGAGDWAQTMSFANAISQDFVVENLNAKWGTNIGFTSGNVPLTQSYWKSASYMFSRGLTDMPNFQTGSAPGTINNNYKLINYSTDTANTRFKVKVHMPFSKKRLNPDGVLEGPSNYTLTQPISIQWKVRNLTTNSDIYVSPWELKFQGNNGTTTLVEGESPYFDMSEDDTFQIEWNYASDLPNFSAVGYQIIPVFDLRASSAECFYQFIPENPPASVVGQINYINGQNSWFAPYVKEVNTFTGSININGFGYNAGSSLLIWSDTASNNAFSSYPQNLPTASENFGFGGVEVLPFNQIKAGDFIRFGYWKPDLESAVHFIEKKYINGTIFGLLVTPAVTTAGTPLGGLPILQGTGSQYPEGSINNFNIYRIDENNNTATVNLYINELYPAKGPLNYLNPLPGGNGVSPSVILFPENASQKLKDNYNLIIKRLTTEGVIY